MGRRVKHRHCGNGKISPTRKKPKSRLLRQQLWPLGWVFSRGWGELWVPLSPVKGILWVVPFIPWSVRAAASEGKTIHQARDGLVYSGTATGYVLIVTGEMPPAPTPSQNNSVILDAGNGVETVVTNREVTTYTSCRYTRLFLGHNRSDRLVQ